MIMLKRHFLHRQLARSLRMVATIVPALLFASPALAQSGIENEEIGWVADVRALRHFSGLRCPDIVANYFRTKVLAADSDRMAGCVYAGPDGISLILRQHTPDTATQSAETFLRTYQAAGFQRVAPDSPGAITFKTRPWTPIQLNETLWYLSGKKADYTIWISYEAPLQKEELAPALKAFSAMLSQLN